MPADTVDMQNANEHLDLERFASFDYDAPTTDELAHLAGCARCRAERQAHISLQAMALAVHTPTVPEAARLTQWESLSRALRAEGLITSPMTTGETAAASAVETSAVVVDFERKNASTIVVHGDQRRRMPGWLRVAAAMALTVGGALMGRLTANGGSLGSFLGATSVASAAVSDTGNFGSVQQASEVLYRAQRDYERASLWLAANDTTVHDSDVYRARLAALDQMMAASRAALRDAPQDPVLNHYFLAAYTAREATLQALGGTLPADKTLERY